VGPRVGLDAVEKRKPLLLLRIETRSSLREGRLYFISLGQMDRLCGLVVRVSGYRYRGPMFDSRRFQIF
jgi:hypothetical protein